MGTAEPLQPLRPGDVDEAGLQFIAEGVTQLAGFELAAISVVHEGRLHTVALSGDDEARAELSELRLPVEILLEELEKAEDWGPLKFVPHGDESDLLDEFSYVPDFQPLDAPDAWHPRDMLVALLEDDGGELRGVLAVDVPKNGLRPDREQRRILEVYAGQAGRAVVTLLERHELEHGLRRSEATSDHRRQLIDVFSHQLQNPVAAILGNLEMLLDDLRPGDPSEPMLRGIERAAGRIGTMLEDLLTLAKVNGPDRPLHLVDVDLGPLVIDVVGSFAAEAVGSGVEVRLDVPATPLLVRADAGELEDLVGNLVSNAIKYSDPGGEVAVTVDRVVVGGEPRVELLVADHGIGIAADDLDRLFEEFFRSDSLEARSRPGTGLGLTVVDRVARRHGGRVEVESEVGSGTTFRAVLPAR